MATLSSSNPTRYSAGAIVLHWLIALALGFQLALGFAMPHDERGFALFQLHKSVGVTILLLTLLRLGLAADAPPARRGRRPAGRVSSRRRCTCCSTRS
jgi:cytochrome b561